MSTWVDDARKRLHELKGDAVGWSYRQGGTPATEPTVLCSLALLAASPPDSNDRTIADRASRWLADIQQPGGMVGITASLSHPHWTTSYALLLWLTSTNHMNAARRAVHWLLKEEGLTFDKGPDSPLGHDTTIPGWSWVEGTHSWIEPTAMAVLALRKAGRETSDRVARGVSLIVDRVIPEGGWNFGNNVVYGQSLRPKPAPTGLALVALAGMVDTNPEIERSLDYLAREVATVRAAQSLGWGIMGLTAWGRRPADADQWLAESCLQVADRIDASTQLPYLLLASTTESNELLGSPAREVASHG